MALAGGHIDADFDIMAPLKAMREAKKVAVLGVAADVRAQDYPTRFPTMKEGNVDLSISSWPGSLRQREPHRRSSPRSVRRLDASPQIRGFGRADDLQLGVRYLDTAEARAFFAETDKVNFELIRKLGLLVSTPKSRQ